MKCDYCNNEIIKPTVGGNGKLYCPYCYDDIIPINYLSGNVNIALNVENVSYYVSSERLYSEIYRKSDKSIKEISLIKRKVLELCNMSAAGGNPFAMVALGYYYESGFINGELPVRKFTALAWYIKVAVLNNDFTELLSKRTGVVNTNIIKYEEVVDTAIYNIYCLLSADNLQDMNKAFYNEFFAYDIDTVILKLKKILSVKGLIKENITDSDENDIGKIKLNDEIFGRAEIYELADGKNYIYCIGNTFGNHLYKEIFDLPKALKSDLFKYYALIIRKENKKYVIENVREFDSRYSDVLRNFVTEKSLVGFVIKRNKSMKFSCPIKKNNNVRNKKLVVKFDRQAFINYCFNENDKEIEFGMFDDNDIKIISSNIIRSDKEGYAEGVGFHHNIKAFLKW